MTAPMCRNPAREDWEKGWRVGSKRTRRADLVAHAWCLLVGHAWRLNQRGTQLICRRCWWCRDRVMQREADHG